ncbi:HSP20 family protein [Saccharomonospora amisosensis]|uniref:HSP20 family protein n=1 Tax=Saccharomonospora amisosensis TaxID=1128677 RepID=A0A7X5UM76_9PSEU|nr:Hsp20/alpha crystallin family protein [Saccharomonospora amisosensis]NIJ10560.1 HSP20 family protein [Saccharomonospora amisosensis]
MALPAVRSSSPVDRWSPLFEFEDLSNQLSRMLYSAMNVAEPAWRGWSPMADLSETEDAYLVEVEVPGVKREDLTVDLTGRELRINGERKQKQREGWFRHRTRRIGRFHYSVTLPQDVEADKIDASLADGVLTVRAPKSASAKPRRITVSGG